MNGPLIFTIIHLINALESIEEEQVITTNVTNPFVNNSSNETYIERQILAEQDDSDVEVSTTTTMELPSGPSNAEELSSVFDKLIQTKDCPCPCSGVKHIPVCGKTTNGLTKDFDSQCHLICHNQCTQAERYAIKFYGRCPVGPIEPPTILNRKNVYSNPFSNRRTDGVSVVAGGNNYQPLSVPLEWECDCSYCFQAKYTTMDYYPICAERTGQKVTLESWCHFDCENKCVRHTGHQFLYVHKGSCRLPVQVQQESDYGTQGVYPPILSPVTGEPCIACNTRCREYYEPVCAKNTKNTYLSFKSRCHMRCHNLCQYENANNNFVHILDGPCPWLTQTN